MAARFVTLVRQGGAAARQSLFPSRSLSTQTFSSVGRAAVRTLGRVGATQTTSTRNVWLAVGAATAAVAVAAGTALSDDDVHVDHSTKLQFKSKLPASKEYGAPSMTLLGTGCRFKYGWVQVYAVGVYLDDTGVGFLKSTTTETTNALAQNKEFFSSLCESAQPRILVIKMKRTVDTPTMVQALEDALRDRVEAREPGAQAPRFALVSFSKMLSAAAGNELTSGTEVSFTAIKQPGGGSETLLHMQINGKGIGCVRSSAVAWALFDTYLGVGSVSPELKTAVASFFGKI